MKCENLNSFQREALIDLEESGYEARPYANWVIVYDGYRWQDVYTTQGVDSYIADNYPLAYED